MGATYGADEGARPHGATSYMPSVATSEEADARGDPACWAHLVCPSCGAVLDEGHQGLCELPRLIQCADHA
jgi:hypothetical protein